MTRRARPCQNEEDRELRAAAHAGILAIGALALVGAVVLIGLLVA